MKNFAQNLTAVLEARNEQAPSNDLQTSINNSKSHARALDQLFGQKCFSSIAKHLLQSLSIISASDNREDFIAVKVVVKLISTANALAKGEKSLVDPYSRSIIENLVTLQNVSNKSALVALSHSIHFTEDDQKQKLVNRYNCSAGTAGTQASSTRMMLRALDVCEVLKSKRGDSLTLKSNERASMLVALFTGKPLELAPEAKPEPAKRASRKPAAKAAEEKPAQGELIPAEEKKPSKPARARKPKAAPAPAEEKPATEAQKPEEKKAQKRTSKKATTEATPAPAEAAPKTGSKVVRAPRKTANKESK